MSDKHVFAELGESLIKNFENKRMNPNKKDYSVIPPWVYRHPSTWNENQTMEEAGKYLNYNSKGDL